MAVTGSRTSRSSTTDCHTRESIWGPPGAPCRRATQIGHAVGRPPSGRISDLVPQATRSTLPPGSKTLPERPATGPLHAGAVRPESRGEMRERPNRTVSKRPDRPSSGPLKYKSAVQNGCKFRLVGSTTAFLAPFTARKLPNSNRLIFQIHIQYYGRL